MNSKDSKKTVIRFPRARLLMVDGGRLGRQKHTIHGLVEFDVTHAREAIRQYRAQTGQALSFSAFFLACLGKAIGEDRRVQAYRSWRGQLVIFEDVDVNMLFELEVDGERIIRPHILRAVNRKHPSEIQAEITAFQGEHPASTEAKFIDSFVRLPGFLRRLFLWALLHNPQLVKDYYGTVLVSSLGMFGSGSGWGIPVSNHTLQLTLGSMAEKPAVVKHALAVREILCVTVSFDHDVVDGAPAARFIQRLKQLVEHGAGLDLDPSNEK